MFTFDSNAAFADKLFSGFLLDVFFDEFSGNGNILIATPAEVKRWIENQVKAMALDISRHLGSALGGEDITMLCSTCSLLGEDLQKLENLDPSIGFIVFHDGRVLK
jgi:hypothetical protein